jgi:hypothetical protein
MKRTKTTKSATTGGVEIKSTSTSLTAKDKKLRRKDEMTRTLKDASKKTAVDQISSSTVPSYNQKTPSTRKLIAKTLQGGSGQGTNSGGGGNVILRPPVSSFDTSSGTSSPPV